MRTSDHPRSPAPLGIPLPGPVAAVLAALVGIMLVGVIWNLQDGISATADAAISLSIGDNLSHGKGLTTPVGFTFHGFGPAEMVAFGDRLPSQGFPPLYPMLMGAGRLVGADGRQVGGALNVIGAVGGIFLLGCVTSIMTRGSAVTVLLVGLWTLTQTDLLLILQFIQPEAFFLFLVLAQVFVVWRYVRPSSGGSLLACIAVTAAAVLFRQLGLALIASAALAILAYRPGSVAHRLKLTGLFGAGSLAPMAVYWILSSEPGSSAGFTQFSVHPPGSEDFTLLFDTVRRWLIDTQGVADSTVLFWLLALSAVGLAIAGWVATHRPAATARPDPGPKESSDFEDDSDGRIMGALLLATTLMYLLVLWGSSTFLDDDVEFGGRYLIPVQPLVFALVGAGIWRAVRNWPRLSALGPAVTACAVLALVPHVSAMYIDGLLLDPVQKDTSMAAYLDPLSPDALVFSDRPEAIYVTTGRGAYVTPARLNRYTGEPNPDLALELEELRQLGSEREVYVVYSNQPTREYLAPITDLQSSVGLVQVQKTPAETMYRVDPSMRTGTAIPG